MQHIDLAVAILYLMSTATYVAFFLFQKKLLARIAIALLAAGFLGHTSVLLWRYISNGSLPVRDFAQTLSLASWSVAGAFLLLELRFRLKIMGIFAAPLAAATLLVSFFLPAAPATAKPIFSSLWLSFHVIAVFLGEAALALACGVGLLYLIQEHAIKTKRPGFFFKRLPSLELLDATGYSCIIAGFTLMTIGLAVGFIYAKSVWGKFWSWDPKEVWSGITWVVYAALLHERLTVGWRGRRAAIFAIIGFGVVLFTFLGVNFLLKGHHGSFTRW